ncbi:DUF308 domain-containing protein [Candidatus Saccharibacteria bacterium]|nr:DUF308 domain-containing protein [Candidatus Saccharibacteria bacterium]
MNKLVVSGFNIWKIFIKNKLASSIMMFMGGVMMLIGAINGHGNDTKSLPMLITSVGIILSFWSFYRIGYVKSNFDNMKDRQAKVAERQTFISQIFETTMYVAVAAIGFFLILNEGFTNKALNLMSGFFTILNGVFGVIYIFKNRENKTFWWKFRIILTLVEFAVGIYFIFASDSIEIVWYIIMGSLTTIAGAIEIFLSFNAENLRGTLEDGKNIGKILKNSRKSNDEYGPDYSLDDGDDDVKSLER